MEHIIRALIEGFEHGKMTRRQLIQSLTIAATAASGTSASADAGRAEEGQALKAVSVHHISYQVADYGKTRDFYANLLGMKVRGDTGKQCSLIFGDSVIIARTPTQAGVKTPLIDHIAYTIDAWKKDEVGAELKRRGLDPTLDPENSFHVKDPDGFHLQLNLVSAH